MRCGKPFGTLKAAIFAMILAMPLAICGAIFTAYFMAPRLRTVEPPAVGQKRLTVTAAAGSGQLDRPAMVGEPQRVAPRQ